MQVAAAPLQSSLESPQTSRLPLICCTQDVAVLGKAKRAVRLIWVVAVMIENIPADRFFENFSVGVLEPGKGHTRDAKGNIVTAMELRMGTVMLAASQAGTQNEKMTRRSHTRLRLHTRLCASSSADDGRVRILGSSWSLTDGFYGERSLALLSQAQICFSTGPARAQDSGGISHAQHNLTNASLSSLCTYPHDDHSAGY